MKKSTLIAVAMFALLGVAYFVTREPQVAVGVKKLALAPIQADALVQLELGGATPLTFKQENSQWTVGPSGQPDKRYLADEAQLKSLTHAVAELKADDFITDKTDKFDEYEVSDSKGLSLKASTASGVARHLTIGKASKAGGVYVREPTGKEVYAAKGSLGSLVRRDVNAWRKKAIATVKVDELTRVQVAGPEGTFSLSSDNGTWKLDDAMPAEYRFDASAAQRLVGQLTNLNAQSFSEGESEGSWTFTFTLTTKDAKTVEVKLGTKRADGTFPLKVGSDAQVYLLPGWQGEALQKTPESLRDLRLLTSLELDKVTRLSIVAGGKRTLATKEGDSWKLVEPKALPAGFQFAPTQVMAQLQRLSNMRALRVVSGLSPAKAGLLKASVEIEVTGEGLKPKTMRLGGAVSGEANQVYAQGDDGLVYAASLSDKSSWETGVELFKQPPPPPNFQGAQGLDQLPPEIRRQLEAQLRQQHP